MNGSVVTSQVQLQFPPPLSLFLHGLLASALVLDTTGRYVSAFNIKLHVGLTFKTHLFVV